MKIKRQPIYFLLCLSMLCSSILAATIHNVDDEKTDSYHYSYVENNQEEIDIDIDELIDLVKVFNKDMGGIEFFQPIITLGNTGSGKTTTTLYLKNEELVRINDPQKKTKFLGEFSSDEDESDLYEEGLYIDLKDEKKRGGIGHGYAPKTLGPSLHRLDGGLSICDFAGFFDNRGYLQKISIALSTRYVIEKSRGIKAILFVVTQDDLTGGYRDDSFDELLKTLGMMFKDPSAHAQSIFFGLTIRKTWKNEKGLKAFFSKKRRGYRHKIYDKYKGLGKDTQNNIMNAKSIIGIRNALQKDPYYGMVKKQELKKSKEQKLSQGNEDTWIRGYAFLNAMKEHQKNNIFCVNPLQPQEREGIINRFIASPPIDKEKIGPIGDKSTLRLLNKEFEQQAREGLAIISTISREKESIEDTKGSIQSIQNDIKNVIKPSCSIINQGGGIIIELQERIEKLTQAIQEDDISDEEEVFCINYDWKDVYDDYGILGKAIGKYTYFKMDNFPSRSYRCLNYRITAYKSFGTKPKDVHDDKVRFYEPDGTFYSDSYIWTYCPKPANNFSIRINAKRKEIRKDLIRRMKHDRKEEQEKLRQTIKTKEELEKLREEERREGLKKKAEEYAQKLKKLEAKYEKTKSAFAKKESLFDFIQIYSFLTKENSIIQDFSNCYKKFQEENKQEESQYDE